MTEPKMMLVMRHDLGMRKGKIAAQAGHAAVEATLAALARENLLGEIVWDGEQVTLSPDCPSHAPVAVWLRTGTAKVCVYVRSEEELLALHKKAQAAGLVSVLILDAGRTEFHGEETYTCLAIEPAMPETVDPITGELPLY